MSLENLRNRWEIIESEQLKSIAEFSLHSLARYQFSNKLFSMARGGERIEDPRLHVAIGNFVLENPVIVGAGWDKKGWAIDGLYSLGFAGTEVGSVLVHPQSGNPRPRLWYDKGVGLNSLGFNSSGMETVAANMDAQKRDGVVGISIGKNKLTPDDQAPWAHATIAERLHSYADYFVINVTSPNTLGLRNLLNPEPLTNIIGAVKNVIDYKGYRPLFVKTTVDLTLEDLDKVIEVCLSNGVDGLIDSNTTIDNHLKALHGWQGKPGGLSGDSNIFRHRATERMKYITRVTAGSGLQRIGVGAINNAESALERIESGAQAVQVVTGIRQHKGKIARDINSGILERIDRYGVSSVQELVGTAL